MKISKIKIKNLYGIKEYAAGSSSVEIEGKNGVGKTSVIDAIRYALTNKSNREYIVRSGETEGEILIETDSGLRINRKARTNQADYKSVKKNGKEVGSPESFLREIFTPLQLSPVEFMDMDKKQQNAIILDMIQYDWDMKSIKEWFGEIPDWVSYDQNILSVLNDIQSETGEYYQTRQNINRDIRNKRAFIEEIAATIPAGYVAETWAKANLGALYREIETIRASNNEIERARQYVEQREAKCRKFEADKEIGLAALDREFSAQRERLNKENERLQAQLDENQRLLESLDEKKQDKALLIEQKYKADIAQYDALMDEYSEKAKEELQSTTELAEEAMHTEKMKSHLNEYRRMLALQDEVKSMQEESNNLTAKINKARELPGEILQEATIPIKGLTIKDGIPLINGLPISNLSEGEKLDLCIDVAIQKPNGLQIILIDGVEKLATDLRNELYRKCKEKGLQFIATRTTDDDSMIITEL